MRARTGLIAVACLVALCSASAFAGGNHSQSLTPLRAAALGALFSTAGAVMVASWVLRREALAARRRCPPSADLPRIILDNVPGFVYAASPSQDIEYLDPRLPDFLGVSAEHLRDWASVTHPEDVERAAAHRERSFRTGVPLEFEFRARRADGVYRWHLVRGTPMRDTTGEIVRWCVLLTDIDDRRRAEDALRTSEQHLRLILDCIPAFIHTLTPTGEIEHVNQTILDFFGLPAEALRDWARVTHPDDIAPVRARLEYALRTGTAWECESRARRADGVYRWLHGRGKPLRDSEGRIVRWYCVFTDADDRRRAEEGLRTNEQQLRLMVDSIPGLICTNTAAGEVEHVNKTLRDYTGKELSELRHWPVVVHPDDLPKVAELWRHSIETREPFRVEVRVRRGDGVYRSFQCSGLPLLGETGEVVRWYNLLTDIDDRLNTEEELRITRARLSRATQVATVGEVSASIAHEINQPLAAVVTNGHACHSWLTADPPNISRALVSLERIIRDGKAAADVIQRIRALYRRSPINKDTLSINDVIEEVCQLIATDARRQCVILRTDLQRTLPLVLADRVQLQQVISNLARNAIDAMETVTDSLRELRIVSFQQERQVVVKVQDTGTGMQDYASAFEPFFTTKLQGMGMGLAICRSIIEAHGGHLWATRAVPAGSVFCFSLPAAESRAHITAIC